MDCFLGESVKCVSHSPFLSPIQPINGVRDSINWPIRIKIYRQLRNDKSSVGVTQDQLVFKCVTPVLISIFAHHAEIKIRRFKSC